MKCETKNSSAGIVRCPPVDAVTTDPPSDGQRERELGAAIRMRDRAADRAAVAGGEVADVRQRTRHERQAVAHELRASSAAWRTSAPIRTLPFSG